MDGTDARVEKLPQSVGIAAVHRALFAPELPMVVEGLRQAILPGRIALAQAIAIDEDNATQNASVNDLGLAVAVGNERFHTRHLRFRQPEKVAL